jgi:hypothetical protein
MAYDGELVRMENGRWARFKKCRICNAGHQDSDEFSMLVAVELDEEYQNLLNAAENSLESYRRRGIPVQVRLDPDARGRLALCFEENGPLPEMVSPAAVSGAAR